MKWIWKRAYYSICLNFGIIAVWKRSYYTVDSIMKRVWQGVYKGLRLQLRVIIAEINLTTYSYLIYLSFGVIVTMKGVWQSSYKSVCLDFGIIVAQILWAYKGFHFSFIVVAVREMLQSSVTGEILLDVENCTVQWVREGFQQLIRLELRVIVAEVHVRTHRYNWTVMQSSPLYEPLLLPRKVHKSLAVNDRCIIKGAVGFYFVYTSHNGSFWSD